LNSEVGLQKDRETQMAGVEMIVLKYERLTSNVEWEKIIKQKIVIQSLIMVTDI